MRNENPPARSRSMPRQRHNTRDAGFLDFLKRNPPPTKIKTGILPSILLPAQPSGPLSRALNSARVPRLHSVLTLDWEVKDNGDTLVVDFVTYTETPERMDPDYLPLNYEREYQRALQPLAKELSLVLNAPVVATVAYDLKRSIDEDVDPQTNTPYCATFKLPRGTAQEQIYPQPSPVRVASRYLSNPLRG